MRRLFSVLILLLAAAPAAAQCIDPATLGPSIASITRRFDAADRDVPAGLAGVAGTGWFLSPTTLVTVEHVAEAMKLSRDTWHSITIGTGSDTQSVPARIRHLAGDGAERIAVLEFATAFAGARSLTLRMEPLAPDERVVSLGFPGRRLRIAGGRFVRYGDADRGDARVAGAALLEMYDGNDRLVLDHGASGAPVLDCAGRVVAVVSNVYVRTMRLASEELRITTAWGSANVVSVPVPVLRDFSRVE